MVQMPHAVTHQDGGSDEINVQGLSGVLADLQRGKFSFVGNWDDFPAPGEPDRLAFAVDRLTIYRDTGAEWQKVATAHWDYIEGQPSEYFPAPHAATHEEGGADALTPANIGANWNKLVNKPSTFPPSAHASSHRPGGSDALPTAAPAPITEGATGAEGSSTSFARADHVHQAPSEWTPKEHGNEKHSPNFLAVDGSNSMQGDLRSDFSDRFRIMQGFILDSISQDQRRLPIIGLHNALAFNTLRGGSVTFTPSPTLGDASALFDGTYSYVAWSNPSGSVVVEVTFHSGQQFHQIAFIHFGLVNRRATAFTVEYYDSTAGTWVEIESVTGWTQVMWAKHYYTSYNVVTKLRFTFTAFDSDVFVISEIGLVGVWSWGGDYLLSKAGGDMYGDIDMNGNDIVNPGLVDGVDVSSHASRHENGGADEINVDGLSGELADYQKTTWAKVDGKPSTFPPSSHASSHENGGSDEINVNGLSGQLADPQKTTWDLVANKPSSFNPSAHASRHEVGGSDEVRPGKYGSYIVWNANNTAPTSYTLCDTGVGARALVLLRITNTSGGTRVVYFRPGDDTWTLNTNTDANIGLSPIWLANGTRSWSIMLTDSQGRISFKCDAAVTGVGITRMAYIKLS